ncbi:hypothetical protein [Streptomyces sp. NPDC088812]
MGALRKAAEGHDVSVKPRSKQVAVAPAEKLANYRRKAEAALAAARD